MDCERASARETAGCDEMRRHAVIEPPAPAFLRRLVQRGARAKNMRSQALAVALARYATSHFVAAHSRARHGARRNGR